MRESRLYGSVRGALSNERPYRVRSLFTHVAAPARVGFWHIATYCVAKSYSKFSRARAPLGLQ
jgi:hypothetical protein